MAKPFKTHRQQLGILRDRKLDIPKNGNHGSKVMRTLERENYYNVVNGYKLPFLKKGKNNNITDPEEYISGTKFDELYSLFKMDRKLRSLFLEYLLLLESHLKSTISYKFTEKFREPNSYLDIQNFSQDDDKIITVVSTIATLSGVIKRNVNRKVHTKKNLNSIEHYLVNHQEVPLWVLVNYLTIGNMCYLYESLDNELANDIAHIFSKRYHKERKTYINLDYKDIQGILRIVKNYRNVCAHEERFYDFKVNSPKLSKYLNAYNRENSVQLTNKEISSVNLFTLLFLLRFYLNKHDYGKLLKKLENILEYHKKDFSSSSYYHILTEMGLTNNKLEILKGSIK